MTASGPGLITSRELRRRLYDAGVIGDDDALRWVAWACQMFGLVSLGYEYGLVRGTDGTSLRRLNPLAVGRHVVTEPFWRVFARAHRSEDIELSTSWDTGHFCFRFVGEAENDADILQRGYEGLMFDRPSTEAFLERVRNDDTGTPVSDADRENWIREQGGMLNSKTAWAAYQMHVGKNRTGLKKNFLTAYAAVWPRTRGRQPPNPK